MTVVVEVVCVFGDAFEARFDLLGILLGQERPHRNRQTNGEEKPGQEQGPAIPVRRVLNAGAIRQQACPGNAGKNHHAAVLGFSKLEPVIDELEQQKQSLFEVSHGALISAGAQMPPDLHYYRGAALFGATSCSAEAAMALRSAATAG